MRRVLAHILVCVMLFTVFQDLTILKAAPTNPLGFELTREMLKEDSTGLSKGERDKLSDETALVKFAAGTAAVYELEYYVEALQDTTQNTITKKVKLNFENTDTKNVGLAISVFDQGSTTEQELKYVPRKFNNTNFTWGSGDVQTEPISIKKQLVLGNDQSRESQEFNIEITNIKMILSGNKQENLKLRVKVDGENIYVFTNGIAKGNITPFKLTSGSIKTSGQIFNGPKGYSITPTHLYSEGSELKSLDYIEDISKIKPGSVPGIKVQFQQVKKVLDDKFRYVDEIADNEEITLQIGTRYTLDAITNSIRLDFVPENDAKVRLNLEDVEEYKSGVVKVENNIVSLYLSQNKLESSTTRKVITWDALETSTIIDGSFQYGRQAEKYWPDNKGYTYLGYTLHRTNGNQVQISIQPYNIKTSTTYSIYVLNNKDSERGKPAVIYEYNPNETQTNNITAIVPAGIESYFQVVATVNADNPDVFESQMVFYKPSRFPITPETTQITSVDNVYVVPSENTEQSGVKPQAIGFDMTWIAPKGVQKILEGGKLYYELLLRKDPNDYDPITNTGNTTQDIYATYSKIFEVSLEDEKVVVKTVAGTAGKDKNHTPELRYSEVNDTFTMENISIMNFGHSKWEKLDISENHLNSKSGEYLDKIKGKESDTLDNRPVPGTYYLSLRTVLVSDDTTLPVVYSEESNLVAVSLDNTNEIISVPSNISSEDISNEDKTLISQKITINNVDIQNYVHKMLEPANLYLYQNEDKTIGRYSGEYEVYLYQKSDKLMSTISDVEKGNITPIKLKRGQNKIVLNDSNNYIEKLRNGGVVPIIVSSDALTGQGEEDFELIGLDPNEVYYMQVRVKLSPWRNNLSEAGTAIPSRYSLFSKEVTFTTTTMPIPPTSEDKVPPTPEKIWVEEQPNNTTAIIGWAPAKFEEDKDVSKTYYEFIRTDLQLTKEEQSKKVEELVEADDKRVGFRSDSPSEANPFISTYTGKDKTWTNLTPAQESSKFLVKDNTLNPNEVYYYYVRTVCIINGKEVKSGWIMVPVTTAPVLPPINLKVELLKNYKYDATKETVISFDAPVPSESLVPSSYDFEIAVEGEMDDEYSITKYSATKLTPNKPSPLTPEGYTHFVYKITGLKQNKRYYIKVRVVDKTKPLTDGGKYPTSLYSDRVMTRTEFDEKEDDKDNKYEEYLKKFDAEVEKLRRRPYWEVEDKAVYKYRETYIKTEVGLQSEYDLVVGENAKDVYYYMPASVFTYENDSKTVLKITLGDYTANIRPYTLTEDNEQIKKAIELASEDSIEDYYVGMSFKINDTTEKINGESPITSRMSVDMELVYIRDADRDVEESIMVALNDIVDTERKRVINKLEKKIYNGTIADDVLNEIINDSLDDIQKDHMKKVEKIMDRTIKREVSIQTIDKPILLMAKVDSFAANAYYLIQNWYQVDCYAIGNGFGIEADRLGTYILTGQVSLITTVPSLAPYQSFIAKYNLTDFFTINSSSVKSAATKEQVYGAVARIIGASRGTDYAVYLKNNGIKGINNIGRTNAIRQDEAIFVIMQGYEKVHKRPINSIVIKNRQSVQNIGAFQAQYRPYVYAAVELKIVNNPNSKVLPSKQLTVEEIIAMLYKSQL